MENAIEVTGVSFAYEDGKNVLEDLTFNVAKGDFFCVAGDNGTGKTTLMKLLAGVAAPRSGIVSREGAGRTAYAAQRHSGQNAAFPATAAEIVSLGLYGIRMSGARRKAAVREALSLTGLAGMESRQIGKLSGGQRQRVLIAKALVGRPDTVILDESAAGVDPGGVDSICGLLSELNRQNGTTVIIVTHDMPSVTARATRILAFKRGGGAEVYDAGEYERAFGR
jgi:zinc transport system ATP-binding protein